MRLEPPTSAAAAIASNAPTRRPSGSRVRRRSNGIARNPSCRQGRCARVLLRLLGGRHRLSFRNFTTGDRQAFGGVYRELVPGERLVYTDAFDDPNLPVEMTVTLAFRLVSVGTDVTIQQDGVPDVILPEACFATSDGRSPCTSSSILSCPRSADERRRVFVHPCGDADQRGGESSAEVDCLAGPRRPKARCGGARAIPGTGNCSQFPSIPYPRKPEPEG